MIESKFNKAYLQIIKEDYDCFLPKENEVSATAENEEVPASDALKQVTFVTSDKALIDAINSGFEEIVIFVNAKDEATREDTVTEVKIGKDSFGDITVTDVEEAKEDEDANDVDDEVEECGDVEGSEEASVESEETEIEEEAEDAGDESVDEGSVEVEEAEAEEENEIDPSEWVEDGVCVKCQSADCDGSCKCEKCGDVNCIGDCQ